MAWHSLIPEEQRRKYDLSYQEHVITFTYSIRTQCAVRLTAAIAFTDCHNYRFRNMPKSEAEEASLNLSSPELDTAEPIIPFYSVKNCTTTE